ncbi:hypothetical protein ACFTSF_34305 [Kribbella sp. NPDC056951]|uniref:hypothetical protein n=1 Tax=Kribbella sp. NPDC056951 TaxID=3345978 RepID=UPI003628EE2B
MPKLKLGAVFYALIAVVGVLEVVMITTQQSRWAGLHGWVLAATATADGLIAALFAIGAATRWGLIADDGPWICQHGWVVVIGLVAVKFVLFIVQDSEAMPFPSAALVFVPHFIRRLQENYYQGRQEASSGERSAASESVE